jgi:hypothetical protein
VLARSQLVHGDRALAAAHRRSAQKAHAEHVVSDVLDGRLGNADLRAIHGIQRFEPCGQIDRIAQGGIGEAQRAADVADRGRAGVDADAHVLCGQPGRLPLPIQPRQRALHVKRRLACVAGVIGVIHGRVPEGHHRIADELVDGPAVLYDDGAHCAQVFGDHAHQDGRRSAFGKGRKVIQIGEQDADRALLGQAVLRLATAGNLARQNRRHDRVERRAQRPASLTFDQGAIRGEGHDRYQVRGHIHWRQAGRSEQSGQRRADQTQCQRHETHAQELEDQQTAHQGEERGCLGNSRILTSQWRTQ